MAIIDILLPKMGESVAEATITKMVVDAGSNVEADEPIVEIATDKVDSEVPAPEDGTLVEWCVSEGDVVQVGAVIARYDVGGEAPAAASAATPEATESKAVEEAPEPEVVAAAMAPLDAAPSRKGPSVVSTRHWFGALPNRRESAWLNWSKCLALVLKDV